jgi:hypothetical protein
MGTKKEIAISRREFARRAAMISAAASLTPANLVGAAAPALAPQTQSPNPTNLSEESRTEVESRLQAILNEYGSRLSDAQKADLRRLCTEAQPALDRLRAFAVGNADGTALYLKPLVEREKKTTRTAFIPSKAAPSAAPVVKPAGPATNP